MNNFNINSQKQTKKTSLFPVPSVTFTSYGSVSSFRSRLYSHRLLLSRLTCCLVRLSSHGTVKGCFRHKEEKEGATWLPYCCDSHRKVSVLFSHPTPSELQLSCSAKRTAEVEEGWDYPGCIARETRLCWTRTELPPCCSCHYLSI